MPAGEGRGCKLPVSYVVGIWVCHCGTEGEAGVSRVAGLCSVASTYSGMFWIASAMTCSNSVNGYCRVDANVVKFMMALDTGLIAANAVHTGNVSMCR